MPGLLVTGRYRLVESIGQGGMGRVWRAADEMLDRQVAVKEMRIDGLDAEDTRTRRARTLREARATARIDHPNVVRVYDVVDEGERLWIVMELVKGRSLERVMVEDGPLGPRAAALLGLGLVEALRQVHARGVLHRDIKPGNVLVESGERTGRRIVLTDFGIAAMQDAKALTMVGMLVGSPDYMAPERVSGRPQGPPSDIWSLGATLCAALGGRSPFSRDTTLATLHAVLYEEPELPAAAGPLTDILTALLEKDPSIRPGLDEVESALHPVAFPPATPTLRVGAGEDVGAGERRGPDGGGEFGEPGDERGAGERDPRGPGVSEAVGGPGTAGVSGTAGASGAVGASGVPDASGVQDASGVPDGSVSSGASPDAGASPDGMASEETSRASSAPHGDSSDVPGAEPATSGSSVAAPVGTGPSDVEDPDASGPSSGRSDNAADGRSAVPEATPPLPWAPRELPTPAYLEARVVRAVRDPRLPEPEPARDVPVRAAGSGDGEPSDAVPAGHGALDGGAADAPHAMRPPSDAPPEEDLPGTGTDVAADAVAERPERPTPAQPFTSSGPLGRPTPHAAASASTEAVSEERSEVRSETPSGNSSGAALRAGATTTSTPLASAPTQDSLSAGAPTEHFPMPDAPTRDTPTRAASAPTRVGPHRFRPGVSLIRGNQPVPDRHPDPDAETIRTPARPTTDSPAPAPAGANTNTDTSSPAPSPGAPGVGAASPGGLGVGAPTPGASGVSAPSPSAPNPGGPGIGAASLGGPGVSAPTPGAPGIGAPSPSAPGIGAPDPSPTPGVTEAGAPEGSATTPRPTSVADLDPAPAPDPAASPAPLTTPRPDPGVDPDPALVLGPHPLRMPPGEPLGPARPATPRRGRAYGGRRRTVLLAAGSVVVAGAVVAVVLASGSGAPGGDDKAGGSPSSSVTASRPASSGGTPSDTPSSTVEGTSRPRSLPPGAHEEAGGFAWATPTGWRRDVKTGAEVHYTSPDGKQELAAKSSLARGDLMETWETSEQNAHQGQDYRKIRLEETTFRDHPAVVWEYTFTLDGVPWHARLLGFNVGDKSYQINTWYQPDIETQALKTYEKVRDSFTVL